MKPKKDRDTSHLRRAWFASVWRASRTGKVLLVIFITVGMFFAVVFYTTGKEPMEFILGGNDALIENAGAECQRMNAMIDKKGLSPLSTALVIKGLCFYSASMRQMPTDSAVKVVCSITVSHYTRELSSRGINPVELCR
jgi:hypothetical protein